MRKLIAAINMTLDGICDHTVGIVDEELHQHYTDLLNTAGTILYGRITFQLMEYWRPMVENPTGNKAGDDFAIAIDRISKIVFSRTLNEVEWKSARVAKQDLKKEVLDLKHQSGKDILIGSPTLISGLTELHLMDEYQLCIHPVIAGKGLALFKNINDKVILRLVKSKAFDSGALVLYYEPISF